jgi:hypothetical protein
LGPKDETVINPRQTADMDIIQTLLNTRVGEIPAEDAVFKAMFYVDDYRIVVKTRACCSCYREVIVERVAMEKGQSSAVTLCDVRPDVTIGEVYQRAKELIESLIIRVARD